MRRILGMSLFLLVFLPSAGVPLAADGPITEDRILSVISSSDGATRRRDVNGIMGHFAPECVITNDLPGPTGRQVIRKIVQEHRADLEQGFAAATEYAHHRGKPRIDIAPGGRTARVTDQVVEVIRINRQTVKSVTRETAVLEPRAGRMIVTSLEGVVLSIESDDRPTT